MNDSPLSIQLEQINKSFDIEDQNIQVLHNINLQANAGEAVFITGPSGCGKTTLLSIISGILSPTNGKATVLNHPLHQLSQKEITRFRAEKLGFVFQQYQLISTLTVAENVTIPLRIQGVSMSKALIEAKAMLEQVGLKDKYNTYPKMLSGGQQQRVAIARALVHNPPLLICDEPTSALDSSNGQEIIKLLKGNAQSSARTLILVTHDSRIYDYADRIVKMEDGKIIHSI